MQLMHKVNEGTLHKIQNLQQAFIQICKCKVVIQVLLVLNNVHLSTLSTEKLKSPAARNTCAEQAADMLLYVALFRETCSRCRLNTACSFHKLLTFAQTTMLTKRGLVFNITP